MVAERLHTTNRYPHLRGWSVRRRMTVEVNHRLAKPDLHVQGRFRAVFKAMFPLNLEAKEIDLKRLRRGFFTHPQHGD